MSVSTFVQSNLNDEYTTRSNLKHQKINHPLGSVNIIEQQFSGAQLPSKHFVPQINDRHHGYHLDFSSQRHRFPDN